MISGLRKPHSKIDDEMTKISPFFIQKNKQSTKHNEAITKKWPGLFISFEGGDGVGKSTQIKNLYARLCEENIPALMTREPGGSEGAEQIRRLLVDGEPGRWSSMTEALLMIASRNDHLEKTILPALRRGEVVICDRFADSSMAYQGIAGELGAPKIIDLHRLVIGDTKPDITFVLFLSSDEGLARARARGVEIAEDRFEKKGLDFHARVHEAYREIVKNNPDRCIEIDTSGSIESAHDKIYQSLIKNFELTKDKVY